MERIGIRDLRQNASRYVARVKAGESLEITERGTLVAMLVPVAEPQAARERLIAEGRLIPASHPTGRVRSPRAVRVASSEPSNQELLDAERGERL